jgi:hypothetical protein
MKKRHSILSLTSLMLIIALATPTSLFAQSGSTATETDLKKRKAHEIFSKGILDNCSHSLTSEAANFALWTTVAYITLQKLQHNIDVNNMHAMYSISEHAIISDQEKLSKYIALKHFYKDSKRNVFPVLDAYLDNLVNAGEIYFAPTNNGSPIDPKTFNPTARVIVKDVTGAKAISISQYAKLVQAAKTIPDSTLPKFFAGLKQFSFEQYIEQVDESVIKYWDTNLIPHHWFGGKDIIVKPTNGPREQIRFQDYSKKYFAASKGSSRNLKIGIRAVSALAIGYVVYRLFDALIHVASNSDVLGELYSVEDVQLMAQHDPEMLGIVLDQSALLRDIGSDLHNQRGKVCANLKNLDATYAEATKM